MSGFLLLLFWNAFLVGEVEGRMGGVVKFVREEERRVGRVFTERTLVVALKLLWLGTAMLYVDT